MVPTHTRQRWDGIRVVAFQAPEPVQLRKNDCHVWSLPLNQPPSVLMALAQTLSEDERQRADAFRVPAPRRRFILTRGALRMLLGRYLDAEPADFRFGYNEFGKPFLRTPPAGLRFNVAHSGDHALIAFADSIDVGVDIEIHSPLDEPHGMARMVLSPTEFAHWRQLPDAARTEAFYDIWTRKEAVAKAFGQGLSMDFTALEVGFDEPRDWMLITLGAAPGYSAALAARTRELRLC